MVEKLEYIKDDINNIENDIKILEKSLRLAADSLHNKGLLSSIPLIQEITQYTDAFKNLSQKVVELSDDKFKIEYSDIPSLSAINDLLEKYIEYHENSQEEFEQALSITKQMIFIKHSVEKEFNEINKVIEDAKRVFEELVENQDSELISSLNSYQHVLSQLYNIIKNIENLSDDEIGQYQDSISKKYGNKIMIAVTRGRIVFDDISEEMNGEGTIEKDIVNNIEEASEKESFELVSNEQQQPKTILDVKHNTSPNLKEMVLSSSKSAAIAITEDDQSLNLKKSILRVQIRSEIEELESEVFQDKEKDKVPKKVEDISVTNEALLENVRDHSNDTVQSPVQENEKERSLFSDEADSTVEDVSTDIIVKEDKPLSEEQLLKKVDGISQDINVGTDDLFASVLELLKDKSKRSLAYHVTKIKNESESVFPIQTELARSVILGLSIFSSKHPEYLDYFTQDFERLEHIEFLKDKDNTLDLNLMLASATIQPTIFSPSTNASQILQNVHISQLENFYQYCQEIAKFGEDHIALDITAVKGDAGEEQLKKNFQSELELWWEKIVHMNMTFGLARKILNRLISADGLLYKIYTAILEDNGDINAYIRVLEADPDAYIRKIEKEVNSTNKSGIVTGSPYKKLQGVVADALNYAKEWQDIVERKEKQVNQFVQEKSMALKVCLAQIEEKALFELNELKENDKNISTQVAAMLCIEAIHNLQKIFSPDILSGINYKMPVSYLLNIRLLMIDGLLLNDDLEVENKNAAELLQDILHIIHEDNWSWRDVLKSRSSKCELEATMRIIKYLSDIGEDIVDLENMQSQMIVECRDKLERQLAPTRKTIENAVALGLLDESSRLEQQATVSEIEQQLKDDRILRFASKLKSLKEIEEMIAQKAQERTEALKERLSKIETIREEDKKRILDIIEKNDVLTANEYLDMVSKGEALPDDTEEEDTYTFSKYFPETFTQLEAMLNSNPFAKVCKMVRNKKSIKGLSWDYISAKHLERAADMLDDWLYLKRTEKVDIDKLKSLFENFGFAVKSLKSEKQDSPSTYNYSWLNLSTDIIANKKVCHVPQYGSGAKGSYRVLCVWNNPTNDELMNEIGETKHLRTPVIVLFFNKLSENRRRQVSRLCRENMRTFIIVDDITTLFMTSATGSRLPLLFATTLPFTYLEPYSSTAGLVPPEMFYGREKERQSIIDPMGSSFIYGGRQLGKTALLRDIERTYHSREEGHLVIWLDLKVIGLGSDIPIDDIWYYLAQSLAKEGVFSSSPKRTITFEKLQDAIIEWLNAKNDRSILLLLDESDRFLEEDGRSGSKSERKSNLIGFTRSTKLKGLMDLTERRFKVVFAGLHNVQRTTKLANHPLAHFGENICIGPLLEHGESRAARALIKEPLEAIGFKISDDLVTRILSQTNYYPSLIQIYCQELISHIYKYHLLKFGDKKVPPYEILPQHVEEAYQSTSLRKSIKDRFLWTLQLDQRYEVIAYSVALKTLKSDDNQSYQHGFSLDWIEKEAKSWWPEGFKDNLGSNIQILLDEMVDLGIFRKSEQNRFALRSPNVGLLLGSVDEMESVLLKEREVPHEFEPSISRSIFYKNKKADYSTRNPLTALQESTFRANHNDVSIIFGSGLSMLSLVKDFLNTTFEDQVDILPPLSNINDFKAHMDKLTAHRLKEDLPMLIVVDDNCAWTSSWVDESVQKLKRLRQKKSFVHVIFLSEPKNSLMMLQDKPNVIEEFEAQSVNIIKLAPWHDQAVRQWLEDTGYVNFDKESRKKIFEITGNWHALLNDFYEFTKKDKGEWKDKLHEVEEAILSKEKLEEYLQKAGLSALPINLLEDLKLIAEFGQMTSEEIFELDENDTFIKDINMLLEWSQLLNYVTLEGNDIWKIDFFIQKLLTSDR